jgi:hypothetical protein
VAKRQVSDIVQKSTEASQHGSLRKPALVPSLPQWQPRFLVHNAVRDALLSLLFIFFTSGFLSPLCEKIRDPMVAIPLIDRLVQKSLNNAN